MKWHASKNKKPKRNQVVVGFWEMIAESYTGLCYYDHDTEEWFDANTDGIVSSVTSPNYWIETPEL